MTLSEELEAKRSEMEALTNLVETEKRELTVDEKATFDGLESACRELKVKIESEVAESERKESEEAECKDFVKAEIEASVRAMSKIDAEAELDKAYAEMDRAWTNYYEACEAAELAARKEELRGLIAEILNEPNMRNLQAEKDESVEALRVANELLEESERNLATEQEAKTALEVEIEESNRSLEQTKENERKMANEKTIYDAVRENSVSGKLPATIEVTRAAADGDTTALAAGIPLAVKEIDRIGKKPMWRDMGLDIMEGAKGTYTLPYDTPRIGEQLAELASATGDATTVNGVLVTPNRYVSTKEFTVETLASATDLFIQSIINDLKKANDRKITADVYSKALAGASTVATADDVTRDSLLDLMAAVEVDEEGSFLSARTTYFSAMKANIDAGSGKFLATQVAADGGSKTYVTETGAPYFYSSLFDNGTGVEYVVYGDLSKIHVADYSNENIIVDPYTKATSGKVVITIVKLANVALKNPNAFAKTADLTSA